MVILQLEEQPPLIQAIFSREVEAVRKFLKSKQHVNYQDFEKRSALHAAAFRGDPAMTKLLIEHGARVNTKDSKWMTPLHRACYSGSEETVMILLNNAADICARDRLWQTPLHIAAASNSLECVSCLLEKIQNPNLTDRSGRTALYHAVLNGHNDIVELLIARGCSVNVCKKKDRPIHWAAYKGHVETMEILLQHGADINAQDKNLYTPLHVAAASGAISVIDILMENGAQVDARNAYGNTPLHIACLNGHGNFASELIRYNADREAVNDRGQTPLHLAAASIHGVHCLNVLVCHGVNLNKANKDGRTPLHMTAIHGRFTRSKTLIDKGAIVDHLDKNNCTALHISAQYGHELLSNTLLSHGADASRKGFDGRTPLHMCCLSGYIECCRIFIKAGVDLNDRDNSGKTPLHCAAYKGAVECVDLLVSSGANFKITDNIGRTALHYAASQGFFFCLFTLVGIGSPVNQADNEGCTALHLAAAYDLDGRCVNYLIEHKADPKLKDPKGFAPIHYAVAENNVNALKYLLYAVDICMLYGPDMPLTTPLHIAAKNGNMEILEKLIPYFPDPNIRDEHGCTPLLLAACHGYANCVQMLLRYGAKVSICDNINRLSPVHHSAKNGHVHCLALLVDNAEDKSIIDLPDGLQRTALMLAISNSYLDCATTLLKSGADSNIVDGDGHTCLFRAVVTGQDNILQMLLNRCTVVNNKDIHGKTVLHVAAACGRYSSLERILPYMDAEIRESPDKNNYTALHWACYNGNAYCVDHFFNEGVFKKIEGNAFSPVHCATSVGSKKCLELLRTQYGSDIVKLKDDKRRGPLHISALQGHVDCAKFLLDQGADINCQDDDGRTPLISAASNGRVQVIEILISHKADVTLYDRNGNTALHMACLRKHNQAALLLLEYISDPDIINMVNNDRKTPLHLSARNGLVDVTRQLILKGSSVTALDADGLTPALCCAPNPSVAQCLAIILASHSLQSCNDKALLIGPAYIKTITKTQVHKEISNRKIQTDITLVKDPDQNDLEQMFEIKFQATASPTEDASNNSASRFFIHYKSRDGSETSGSEQESPVTLKFDEDYSRTSILDLHSSQSDTVLAPKPIYSEEDYEKMIKQSNEEKSICTMADRPSLKSTRKKTKIKDDIRFPSAPRQIKQEHFKSKSAVSVLTTFRSDNFSDFVPGGNNLDQNKDPVPSRKSERMQETLERYTGAIPKTTRFPKSTNKRLKSQKAEEDDSKDHVDTCHVCKQVLGTSDSDDQNIPLETMQTAIEKALAKKGCSSNRCLLAFLDESYELNAKNAHLIYHGMLNPKCEPYIAKRLNLCGSDVEILESTGEETNYTIRKVKSTGLDTLKSKSSARGSHGAKVKDSQTKGGATKMRQDKPSKIFNKQSRDGKSDLKSKMIKDDENTTKVSSVQRRLKDAKKFGTLGQRNLKNFVIKSALNLDPNKIEVQKVQSDSQKVYVSKLKKPKSFSITDVTNQQDGDGNYNKVNASHQKTSDSRPEGTKMKDVIDGEAFPEYLKPLTNFNLDTLVGCEDGGHVRCYSTYWCFPELNENNNDDTKQGSGQDHEETTPQTKVTSKSDSHFVKKHPQRGDSTSYDNTNSSGIRSEITLRSPARKESSVERIPITFLKTSQSGSNVEKDGMIYFNDKLIEESTCTIRENQEIGGELINDEEIEELERLRQLDENLSKDDSSEAVQDTFCNLERRAGVLDIKKNSSEDVDDWCEDMQQFFTQTRRKQLAENAEKSLAKINVEEWKNITVQSTSKLDADSARKIIEEHDNSADVNETPESASSKVYPRSSDDIEAVPVKIESATKKDSISRSNNHSCILIEDGEVIREPSTEMRAIEDDIEIHYDNKISMAKSSEYYGGNVETISNVTLQVSSKSITSKTSDSEKSLADDVSMLNDIATVTAEEHLIKNTILNEHSEAFLERVKNRSKENSTIIIETPPLETFTPYKRILIRKTDGENKDTFIMKKPAKVIENIDKIRDDKPINWKLYMAHRCLQLSDNMNEQSTHRSWSKKRPSLSYVTSSSSTNLKDKKKKAKTSELKGDFRKTRSAEPDEKMKDSYRYSGLKFEEHDTATLKINDIIERNNVEKPKKVNFSERVYIVKDKETVYSLCEDEPEGKREEAADTDVTTLDDWQTFINEGITKTEEITPEPSSTLNINSDFVDLPKKSTKSFLESIDIKDFVGHDEAGAKKEEYFRENALKENEVHQKLEEKEEESYCFKEFQEPCAFTNNFVDIDYELDKLEDDLKKDVDVERFLNDGREKCDEIDAEFEENILKLEEERTDEEKDDYDLNEMYKFEDSGREHIFHSFPDTIEEERSFDASQEDSSRATEIAAEDNIEATILKENVLSFDEIEGEPNVREILEAIREHARDLEITSERYAYNEECTDGEENTNALEENIYTKADEEAIPDDVVADSTSDDHCSLSDEEVTVETLLEEKQTFIHDVIENPCVDEEITAEYRKEAIKGSSSKKHVLIEEDYLIKSLSEESDITEDQRIEEEIPTDHQTEARKASSNEKHVLIKENYLIKSLSKESDITEDQRMEEEIPTEHRTEATKASSNEKHVLIEENYYGIIEDHRVGEEITTKQRTEATKASSSEKHVLIEESYLIKSPSEESEIPKDHRVEEEIPTDHRTEATKASSNEKHVLIEENYSITSLSEESEITEDHRVEEEMTTKHRTEATRASSSEKHVLIPENYLIESLSEESEITESLSEEPEITESLNEESLTNASRDTPNGDEERQRLNEKYVFVDNSSADTVVHEEDHQPNKGKHWDANYLRNSPSKASSRDSDEDYDMLDTGFSHVKVDEMMKLKYHSSGDNCENPTALRYVEESSSAESLPDSSDDDSVEACKSNHGDGQCEEVCIEDADKEELEGENSQSEEHTTSFERSDEYHDANLLDMEDIDILPEDSEDTNDNIYFDTESESSASNTEIVSGDGTNSVIRLTEENLPKEDNFESNQEKILIENFIQGHLEKIIVERCMEPSNHSNKKISSQKSVHFKFVNEENQAVNGNSDLKEETNGETLPENSENENNVSVASLNTIYHVEREHHQGFSVESNSDMNCLGQIISDGKTQQALFDKLLKEKISLIEGVAPAEGQIIEKIEDNFNIEDSAVASNLVLGEDIQNVVKDQPEEVPEIKDSSNAVLSEINEETIEEIKETPSNNGCDTVDLSNSEEACKVRHVQETKFVDSNVTVLQLKQNIELFAEQPKEDVSLSSLSYNNSEDGSLISKNEDMSVSSSVFSGNISEDTVASRNCVEENAGVVAVKKLDEQCEEMKIGNDEYEELYDGIKLTQNYMNDNELAQGKNICEELILENQASMGKNIGKLPECTSSDFKKAVKISRNVKVEDTDEYLLLDERRSGEVKKNKKSFPSVSKLGKKTKKDSNCKIS